MAAVQLILPLFDPQSATPKKTADMRQYQREWRAARRAQMTPAEIEEEKRRHRDAKRAERRANPEAARSKKREYYAAHKEELRAKRKAKRDADPSIRRKDAMRAAQKRSMERASRPPKQPRITPPDVLEARAERRRQREREWRKANPEQAHEKDRRQAARHRERKRLAAAQWRKANPARSIKMAMDYEKQRIKEDVQYRIRKYLRRRIGSAVRRAESGSRAGSAVRDLGCSIEEFRAYIEELFEPGMTWENRGPRGWHLDHIRPLASLDLTDREQFLQACHYTNYQPLWAADNLTKGAKITLTPA